ncbi:MAG: PIN domain-containing protein, partial [Clostridia bacterium]|nr:PIN domain-containing protein [Clostridia bacterium]
MNGNLMDTNVIVRVLNGDRQLVQQLSSYNNLCSCSIVLGELLYGAEKSARTEENKKKAKDFCAHFNLLKVDEYVSETYGNIKNELLAHGKVMPENDMWIGA